MDFDSKDRIINWAIEGTVSRREDLGRRSERRGNRHDMKALFQLCNTGVLVGDIVVGLINVFAEISNRSVSFARMAFLFVK